MFKPIIVRTLLDGRLQIIGGQHRAMIAKRLGLLTVPVMNLGRIGRSQSKRDRSNRQRSLWRR
ncbi:ParB/Srx family N-terminal domain-containing protein [Acinetobacter baumannii]|uniref:ParB/Srx family N-terminal domain-containing protein n=1 Tax=Acinetobacter baumannii TaxID=470 RepID=UPI001D18A981|nr:ParB/Srx family N-terminal domain-containing protein [Acinetobacter baumannii]